MISIQGVESNISYRQEVVIRQQEIGGFIVASFYGAAPSIEDRAAARFAELLQGALDYGDLTVKKLIVDKLGGDPVVLESTELRQIYCPELDNLKQTAYLSTRK